MRINFKDEYIDYNYYLNYKKNYKFLKLYIYKHNKEYINKMIKNKYIYNNIELDNKQKEVIFSDENNTLVFAGAGTGKTFTIESKIDYLINNKNINEDEILCISFTNSSVDDLKNKIKYNINIYTFHKLAIEILKDYKINKEIINDYLEYIIDEIFLSNTSNIDDITLKYFNNIISSFIKIFKNKNKDISLFNKYRNNKLLKLIKIIYFIYEDEIKSSNIIDFNDIINYATKYLDKYGLKRTYKYIIVDEFQDISYASFKFLMKLKEESNAKLLVVGDDYQSIYRFAGSKIDYITKFNKYFKHVKIIKLNNTYRSCNELIRCANNFINKNIYQIRKEIHSNKHIVKPIKIVYFNNNMNIKFKNILDNNNSNFMILSRNNFDIKYLLDDDITFLNNNIIYNNKTYEFKTVHKSKGLEEDNIIILNMSNSYYGFPNKRKDKILDLVIDKDRYLYEEERRLFYVALTRSKNYVYLLVPKKNQSIFVKELIKYNKKYIEVVNL